MAKTKKQKVFLMIVGFLVAVVLLVLTGAFDSGLVTRNYILETEKVSDPVRLAVLTDLHSCDYGENQEELLNAVLNLDPQPDGILLVGDIVDDELPEDNAWYTISKLSEFYCCFYVTGNHEWKSGEVERICGEMERLGVTVLHGDSFFLSNGQGQMVAICGIDDPNVGAAGQLEQVGESVDPETFTVLMSHRPERIDEYLSYSFDLILCGHAHGGQWRLPGLINGLLAPNQGLFPKYAGGQYDFEDTTMIVSRGLARESTRVPRIYNPPELVVVDIVPAA